MPGQGGAVAPALLLYAALRLRPEPGGGYHLSIVDLSTVDTQSVRGEAADQASLGDHRLPIAPA